eukprot:TRINITY_DN1345_c0_g1_i8.p1 TRINITY_DN1345_c0_g1~~TRINITY_DN1345_c0_g1_i8.p1  ORF type:complete len:208 (+),score=1.98 TRINITY_DN1345_c0_g1_i8:78-626(+)
MAQKKRPLWDVQHIKNCFKTCPQQTVNTCMIFYKCIKYILNLLTQKCQIKFKKQSPLINNMQYEKKKSSKNSNTLDYNCKIPANTLRILLKYTTYKNAQKIEHIQQDLLQNFDTYIHTNAKHMENTVFLCFGHDVHKSYNIFQIKRISLMYFFCFLVALKLYVVDYQQFEIPGTTNEIHGKI